MKKVIALLVVMAVFSTTVFAAPLSSVAGSVDMPSRETSRIELSANTDDLFADVRAVALTTEEAQAVEGEGWGGYFVSCVLNYFIVPKVYSFVYTTQVANNTNQARANINAIGMSVIVGSVITGIGIACPW